MLLTAAPAALARPTASVTAQTLSIAGDGTPATMVVRPIGGGVEVTGADPGPGCTASAAGASCPTSDTTTLQATLSAADESLRVEAPFAGATIGAGGGADTIAWAAASGASVLGGDGADRLSAEGGGAGAVSLDGQGDDDRLDLASRTGSGDSAIGGPGTGDTATYAGRLSAVRVNLDAFRNDGAVGEGDLVGVSVEVVIGTAGADTLISDDRPVTFDGGLGVDTIDGRGGRDTLSYNLTGNRPGGVSIDLQAGLFAGDRVSNMENLTGSAGPDRLAGTQFPETIDGAGGDDVIIGRTFQDTLVGGDGRDIASYEDSPVPVIVDLGGIPPHTPADAYQSIEGVRGSRFDDELRGTFADESLEGGAGRDLLIGSFGRDTFAGGDQVDTVSYEDGRGQGGRIAREPAGDSLDGEVIPADVENMRGSPGDDVIVGGAGVERLEGAGGNDRFLSGPGADVVVGGPGDHDVLSFADQPGGALIRLSAGREADEFREGDESLLVEDFEGSPAADEINVAEERQDNVLTFGAGDLVSYRGRQVPVSASPGTGPDDGTGAERDDISILTGIVEGTELDDFLSDGRADGAPNAYRGLGGNDTVSADASVFRDRPNPPADTPPDSFDGGDGVDTLQWFNAQPVTLSLADRRGSYNDDILRIENLVGGEGDDTLIGDDGDGFINGRQGNDTIDGRGGADRMFNEEGADTYAGGEGVDDLNLTSSAFGQTVTPNGVADDGAPGERDNVGADIESIVGTSHSDTLTAIPGGRLAGLEGQDRLAPPPAPALASLDGGGDVDTLDARGRSPLGLTLSASDTLQSFDNLFYVGFENLTGGAGPDVLTGSAAGNRLDGSGGNDRLDGGSGLDLVLGGPGADQITDGDAVADRLSGSIGINIGNINLEERAQAESHGPSRAMSSGEVLFDDRLLVQSNDPSRSVVVDLSAQTTDRGDVVTDIESVAGTERADRIIGDNDENTLAGGGGDDVIEGRGNNDRLNGGVGFDRLTDRSAERDGFFGGDGNDFLDTVDSTPPTNADAIACEGGIDQLSADLLDPEPADCEVLFSAPVRQFPLTRVRALATRPTARGHVRVRISCPRAAGRACRGTAFLERGLRRRAKPEPVGRRAYRIRAGRSIAARIRLDRGARRSLARRGTLDLRLVARELDKDGRPRESSAPLRLRRR